VKWDGKILFLYGITHKLSRFMDAGAPGVYRDIKREELLEICNRHGMLYAWVSFHNTGRLPPFPNLSQGKG